MYTGTETGGAELKESECTLECHWAALHWYQGHKVEPQGQAQSQKPSMLFSQEAHRLCAPSRPTACAYALRLSSMGAVHQAGQHDGKHASSGRSSTSGEPVPVPVGYELGLALWAVHAGCCPPALLYLFPLSAPAELYVEAVCSSCSVFGSIGFCWHCTAGWKFLPSRLTICSLH